MKDHMVKEKDMMKMVDYYLKENIKMVKGMEKEGNIIKMEIVNLKDNI